MNTDSVEASAVDFRQVRTDRLDGRKTFAGYVTVIGIALVASALFTTTGPTRAIQGGIGVAIVLAAIAVFVHCNYRLGQLRSESDEVD